MSSSIDATVVLGLAGKMNQVFAEPDTFQTFPLAPIGMKADNLRALAADPLGTGANAHAQFSLLVNEIPSGPLWQPDGDRLWDVYGDVLAGAQVFDLPRSPEQQAAYDKAFGLLYTKGKQGVPEPSPTVVAYERYRDAYLNAAMEYNNRKGEAEMTPDAAVKEAWAGEESGLQAAVADAQTAWVGPGKRNEVEEARRVIRELGSTSPLSVWAGYRKLFDPDLPEIYFRTSVDSLSYVPTGYLPTDVADVAWPRITVSAGELQQFAGQAPEELRNRLTGGPDGGIEMVSFEYSYVTVSRPWFAPQLFASRAWRFRPPGRVLSDGGNPPTGDCPAYVTGLVLARNITVQRKAPVDGGAPAVDLGFLPTTLLAADVQLARPYLLSDLLARTLARKTVSAEIAGTVADQPMVSAATIQPLAGTPSTTAVSRDTLFPSMRNTGIVFRPSPMEAAPQTTTTDPSEVYVLAFQCRILPLSPDPDPAFLTGVPAATPKPAKQYTVVKGDTLSKIAGKLYGDPKQWQKIYAANRAVIGADPDKIKAGQQYTIP